MCEVVKTQNLIRLLCDDGLCPDTTHKDTPISILKYRQRYKWPFLTFLLPMMCFIYKLLLDKENGLIEKNQEYSLSLLLK